MDGSLIPEGNVATRRSAMDGNTVFGSALMGGNQIDLTINSLYAMIQNLESQQAVLLDRSKSRGMIFKDLAFASEAEFCLGSTRKLTSRVMNGGLAAFVDLVSIWVYTVTEQVSTQDWLQTFHRSVATGLTNSIETQYINSMQNRYPIPFVGSATTISATQILKMFESVASWRDHGLGDGTKD